MDKPLDASVVTFVPVLFEMDAHGPRLLLELGSSQPLVNWALENYAHGHFGFFAGIIFLPN